MFIADFVFKQYDSFRHRLVCENIQVFKYSLYGVSVSQFHFLINLTLKLETVFSI